MNAAFTSDTTIENLHISQSLSDWTDMEERRRQLDNLYQRHHSIEPNKRLAVLSQISNIWQQEHDRFDAESWLKLATMAEYFCDWKLLRHISEHGLIHSDSSHCEFRNFHIRACWLMADYQTAIDKNTDMLLQYPDNKAAISRNRFFHYYLHEREQLCLQANQYLHTDELMLEPLDEQHGHSFLWQYFNSDIPKKTDLPEFHSIGHWTDWLKHEQSQGKKTFAILHQTQGFVGVTSLTQVNDYGYFYYWVGPDFQGNGYGPAAVQLMLQHARHQMELRRCYATIYDYNRASIRAVEKMAFQALPLQVSIATGKLLLFYLGPEVSLDQQWREIETFLPPTVRLSLMEQQEQV